MLNIPGSKKASRVRRIKLDQLDPLITMIKVPCEFSRRSCSLMQPLKAENYRNLALFFFPVILEALQDTKAKQIWARFCYIMRMSYGPTEELHQTPAKEREACQQKFHQTYLQYFGNGPASYNFHLLTHLFSLLVHGPLPERSAVAFESSFAIVRRSFRPGTRNVPKQIMEAMYLRLAKGHTCEKLMTVKPQTASTKYDDSLLYKFDPETQSYTFKQVVSILGDGLVRVQPCLIAQTSFDMHSTLKWSRVGCFYFKCYDGDNVTEERLESFSGKAIRVDTKTKKYILAVPPTVLSETSK